jgi:hypothetical protein
MKAPRLPLPATFAIIAPPAAAWVAALAAMVLGACVTTAAMQRPAELQAAEPVTIGPLPAGQRGRLVVGAEVVAFERSADSLTALGTVRQGRGTLQLSHESAASNGQGPFLRCSARQLELVRGSAAATVQPLALTCEGPGRSLQLHERPGARLRASGAEREGEYRSGGTVLQLRSVHRLQGSPVPLEQPAGYLLSHAGQPLAALDLAGGQPRLWQQPAAAELRRAALEAALVLALAWEA